MPKQVEQYILEREIGSGQFGKVYKGYNKDNAKDVAVKVVRREILTGKFLELLENEIKVLRACDNINIIKLYDIKKTKHNFYLMLEYCNEGDLGDYLKKKKHLTEDEAVDFLIQILNAFKTLVKNNIMHRDFKLANILKHDGLIKIADFGFSKLLGKDNFANTMLGSPLNMAPEVLDGAKYNNKADIWSIGTVFYEMLFGRPPFVASNLPELAKNVKTKKLEIPRKINNISPICEDLLRTMLVVKPEDRISWEDLFKHKINTYREEKIKKELEDTLKTQDLSLVHNMSKFYINNNKVVENLQDYSKKQEMNEFARKVAQGKKEANKYEGPIYKLKEGPEDAWEEVKVEESPKSFDSKQDESDSETVSKQESLREARIRVVKRNSNRILHERNKYVFLASVAEDCVNKGLGLSEYAAFVLVKKLLIMITNLKSRICEKENMFNLEEWPYYVKTKEFEAIVKYIANEYDVFEVYFNCMYDRIVNLKRVHPKIGTDFIAIVNKDLKKDIDKVFFNVLQEYVMEIAAFVNGGGCKASEEIQAYWLHIDQLLDCVKLDEVFAFEDAKGKQFDFKLFYEEIKNLDEEGLMARVNKKFKEL